MSDDLIFSDEAVKQIQELLNAPTFDRIRRADQAASLRNDVHADWITNFMNRMMQNEEVSSHMVDTKTGQTHTVSSLVDELRERVQLDAISKEASLEDIPLTAKAIQKKKTKSLSDDEKQNVSQFIEDMYSSHRGYCDTPAVMYACKEKFGNDLVIDNLNFIQDKIMESKDKHKSPGVSAILPSPYQGEPMKADPQNDMFQPLFEHIKNI